MSEYTYEIVEHCAEFFTAHIKYDDYGVGITLVESDNEIITEKATLLCNVLNNTKNIPKMGWLKMPSQFQPEQLSQPLYSIGDH